MLLSKFIPLKEAREIVNNHQKVTKKEVINLHDGYLRVLAEEIKSLHNSPPFDKSAMDGYAVIAEDTFGASNSNTINLKIIDRIGAGEYSTKKIAKGEAIKVATGSPVPDGATGVLMEEYTLSDGDDLEIHSQVTPMENIAPLGEDIQIGDIIVRDKTVLRPQELGLIASAGFYEISVYKKPKIKLIITGNELVDPAPTIDKAQIINSNQYTITSMIKSAGADIEITHARDDFEDVKDLLLKESNNYDLLITTGGTAISKGDVVVDAVDAIGEVMFHGVAIRPGKPIGFGMINETPIFMLSGYPVAAMAQFDIFLRHYLFKMQNIDFSYKIIKGTSGVKIPSNLGRTDYVRAFTSDNTVKHALNKGSGIIRSMVEANSYLIIDENQEGIYKGDEVDIIFFDSLNFNF
ncbi:molybdopterin molybdotransferase MoeA [Methanobrevibacter filiformis]|nr:gephyrin-like molybdotransferase Glp [Methanobrevibacter filiformis]